MTRFVATFLALMVVCLPVAAQPRGDAAAVAAAERLLEQAGGADAWRKGTFEVAERAFLRSGETAELRIVRDFKKMTRLIERRSPSTTFKEWVRWAPAASRGAARGRVPGRSAGTLRESRRKCVAGSS